MNYMKIKQLKEVKEISTVNELIKVDWILVLITSNQGKINYLLGRI